MSTSKPSWRKPDLTVTGKTSGAFYSFWGLDRGQSLPPRPSYRVHKTIHGPAIVHLESFKRSGGKVRYAHAHPHKVSEPGLWGWIGRMMTEIADKMLTPDDQVINKALAEGYRRARKKPGK